MADNDMENKKTILFLGGSRQQVPAIEKAKEMGLRTVLIDYLPDNPGQFVADKWYQESTTDVEAVYLIAKEEKVDGILPYASDPAALPAAIVCERLGLPTNPVRSIEILGVKHKFRDFLKSNGFSCPKSVTFSSEVNVNELKGLIKGLKFPIVIKPTDSSGSKGVSFLYDNLEIEKALHHAKEYSRNKVLIAEEYIRRGFKYIIGGDIFIDGGKIILFGEMACMREDDGQALIPIGKKFHSGLTSEQQFKVHGALQRLINKLHIKSGEMNIELILDDNDDVHFLEVGPRAGGNMIPIQLSDIYGVDLIEANIKSALGIPTKIAPKDAEECYLTYVLHSDKDGLFSKVEYSPEILPYIYRDVVYKQPGDVVERFDGAGKAVGIVFMKFPTMEEMERHIPVMPDNIQVILTR